jgi:large subunit ribosomal protein L22
MRLVIDLIRGRLVPEADAILRFSKKFAARQIRKVLKSAVANAEQLALKDDRKLDVDRLRVTSAVVNAGPTLKRFTSAAMGRGTPIMKRTSHVEIHVGEEAEPTRAPAPPKQTKASTAAPAAPRRAKAKTGGARRKKPAARGAKKKKPAKKKGSK